MNDAFTVTAVLALAMSCLCLSLVVAFLAATVPAMWWLLMRATGRAESAESRTSQMEKDVAQLDELVDRLCKAANLER